MLIYSQSQPPRRLLLHGPWGTHCRVEENAGVHAVQQFWRHFWEDHPNRPSVPATKVYQHNQRVQTLPHWFDHHIILPTWPKSLSQICHKTALAGISTLILVSRSTNTRESKRLTVPIDPLPASTSFLLLFLELPQRFCSQQNYLK